MVTFPCFSTLVPDRCPPLLTVEQGASPGLSEGRTEGVWQLLGESKTAGHEGVDHDHVPEFRDLQIFWLRDLQIFGSGYLGYLRYSSDIFSFFGSESRVIGTT